MLSAVLTVSLTRAAIETIQDSVTSEYGASLNAVMDTSEAALLFWSEQRKSELLRLSENEIVQNITLKLNDTYNTQDLSSYTNYQQTAEAYLNSLNALLIHSEYHLISPDGVYLYSNRKGFNSQLSSISANYPKLFADAMQGKASFVPPIKVKTGPDTFEAVAFFVAPIILEAKVIGVIASSHNPEDEISRIMALGRIGETGESYVVNADGYMVSRSRFRGTLVGLDRLSSQQSEVLNLRVTSVMNSTQGDALTAMASSVTQGKSAQNLAGYYDYRGIKVIGTWRWLPDLQLGIATEIDYAEANAPFVKARNTIIALVAVNIGIALSMAIILFVMSSRTNQKLRRAANVLEEKVATRTHDLNEANKQTKSEKVTLQSILDNIPDPIFCKDNEGRYVRINKSFAELTGYSQDFIVGKDDFALYSKEDAEFFVKDDDKLLAAGVTHIVERSTSDVAGNEFLFETRKTLIHYDSEDQAGILGISRDITDRKRFEEAMLNATRTAQEASNAKSEFLARMSHEIRTPMNGVLGMIDLLLDSQLDSDQTHKLKVAKNSASSLLTVINDILDFSRVEAGKLELEAIDFNLSKQIETIAQTLAMRCDAKGVELIVDVTDVEQSMVIGDPIRLRQVMTNLISNAIKFTETGQIVVRAESTRMNDITRVECSVEDTGIGIPDNSLVNLFDSFTQVDTSTTRVYGGSGLGLAICRRLINLMGGEINVQSVINEGSIFSFVIELPTSFQEEKPLPKSSINDWRVLVVDDNATNREILENQLSSWGVEVILAVDAFDALEQLKHEKLELDLIITDMNMPNKDGLSLVADIKLLGQYKDVKILMLSSMSFQMSVDEFRSLGLDACLMKPVGTSDMFNALSLMSQEDSFVTENTLASYATQINTDDVTWPSYQKILIVEDNPVNQLVAEGILKKFGLHYGVAIDGSLAIQTLINSELDEPYTLILMDCQMPVLDGYKASEKIRQGEAGERYIDIPIVAMTANAMKGDREKCLASGMNDHVPKPIDGQVLQQALVEGFRLTPPSLLESATANLTRQTERNSDHIVIPKGLLTMDWQSSPPTLINQPSIYLKSLSLFSKQHAQTALSFPNTRAEMDELIDKLHTIKGSSGNVGIMKVYRLSIILEEKINNNSLISSDLARFNTVLSEAMIDIKKVIESNRVDDADPKSTRSINDLLNEIKPLVERSELVPFELVDELSNAVKDHIEDTVLRDIVIALEAFDYDTTKKLIEGKL